MRSAGTAMVCAVAAASALSAKASALGRAPAALRWRTSRFLPAARSSGRGDELAEQDERSLGGQVEAAFEAGKDADQEVVQAGQALGLGLDEIATPANQQAELEVDLAGGFDAAQVLADAHLLGDDAGIARIGFVLAADRALTGAVDGQARHMDEREPGSIASARPAMPPTTSRPMRTLPPDRVSSSMRSAIAAGVFSSLRSMCTTPSK